MKVAIISRSTLFEVPGGDTVQILETAKHLCWLGIRARVFLAHENISYEEFDLLHFFNITRPAAILYHLNKTKKPCVITPIFVDYSEYDKNHRNGLSGFILKNAVSGEYAKTIGRWVLSRDNLRSKDYLWRGHERSIRYILCAAKMILPNSDKENRVLQDHYSVARPYIVIPNGVNEQLFSSKEPFLKEKKLVICAARIEGIKNQINLIRALNHTDFNLVLIGQPSGNQQGYYRRCRKIAGPNVTFTGKLSQAELVHYYRKAKVHALASWFETCGLSSLEAAAMGCNLVITDKGFTREYFGNEAFYCAPQSPESIYQAVEAASESKSPPDLQARILENFTWKAAAEKTLFAYNIMLGRSSNTISPATRPLFNNTVVQ